MNIINAYEVRVKLEIGQLIAFYRGNAKELAAVIGGSAVLIAEMCSESSTEFIE